eukprot:TRINITY_DN5372_c0_g1_i1.p1 TRINITY_DN5372_c0_g1~~TRINITY_DN5372_c0_g1_i1.p1  ORF type:complete len:675 (+),score=95.43 TRINITY_DN5372_c0_g1_i1:50-2026(+)
MAAKMTDDVSELSREATPDPVFPPSPCFRRDSTLTIATLVSSKEVLGEERRLREGPLARGRRVSGAISDVFDRLGTHRGDSGDAGSGHCVFDNKFYTSFMALVVFLNTIALGLEADYPEYAGIWFVGEHIFTVIFLVEFIGKMLAFHLAYFDDSWNCLDFALVLLGVVDMYILRFFVKGLFDIQLQSFSVLRTLRMCRLARVLRLVGKFKRLAVIGYAVADSMRTTCWASLLLGLCIYVCAIFCVEVLGRDTETIYPGYSTDEAVIDQQELLTEFNPHVLFGSMLRSMVTLFGVATLSEWREIVWPVLQKQPAVIVFFIGFNLFVTFGVMNVIVGMIVEGVMAKSQSLNQESIDEVMARRMNMLERIRHCLVTVDVNSDGAITPEEIENNLLVGGVLSELLMEVDLPQGFTAKEFHAVLDRHGMGVIGDEDLVEGLYRLLDTTPFKQTCLLQMSINELKMMVRKTHELVAQICLCYDEISSKVSKRVHPQTQRVTGGKPPSASKRTSSRSRSQRNRLTKTKRTSVVTVQTENESVIYQSGSSEREVTSEPSVDTANAIDIASRLTSHRKFGSRMDQHKSDEEVRVGCRRYDSNCSGSSPRRALDIAFVQKLDHVQTELGERIRLVVSDVLGAFSAHFDMADATTSRGSASSKRVETEL